MELPVKARPPSSYTLQTKNLSYKLYTKFDELNWVCFGGVPDANPNFILKEVNCEARPGEVTAIAGPSGAGKTTLLEILAGKISDRQVVDKVMVNNRPMDAKWFRRLSSYVTQDDALFPLLTVQETLMYSALLRLPGGKEEAGHRVDLLIKELGLDHVAGSRVRGISGGERRRVSIGVDLVHDPVVVLIDEPTSGLDSASALHIITLLKSMAVNQGKTIILTIHQPGFRILETFDRIVLLSNGHVMHNGSLHFLKERLQFLGHHIPRHVNVLEFAIDAVETLDKDQFDHVEHRPHPKMRTIIPYSSVHDQQILPSYPNSILKEVVVLGQRFCSNVFRSKQLFSTRIIQALVAGLILGTIFLNVGRKAKTLQSQLGFFAFTLTFLLSSTTEVLPIFLQERRIVMQETSRGAYRVSSYVVSNFIIFLPFLLLIGLLFSIPVYWLVGLRGEIDGFGYFSLTIWMVLLMSNSFVACFSALVPNFIMGSSIISGLFGSFFLFSGYFISKNRIPNYWMFMHYLSLFKYPYECLLINEFGGEKGKRRCLQLNGGVCSMNGREFLSHQHLQESQKWTNLAVMFGFIIGYRLLCFVILWYRHYRNR